MAEAAHEFVGPEMGGATHTVRPHPDGDGTEEWMDLATGEKCKRKEIAVIHRRDGTKVPKELNDVGDEPLRQGDEISWHRPRIEVAVALLNGQMEYRPDIDRMRLKHPDSLVGADDGS